MEGVAFGGPTMLTKMTEEYWAMAMDVFTACRSRSGRDARMFLEALHYFTVHNIT